MKYSASNQSSSDDDMTPWVKESPLLKTLALPFASTLSLYIILVVLVVFIAALAGLPWQQSAAGRGQVVAFAPIDRQQNIEAPIEGRVVKWYVVEGQTIDAGQPIVDVGDNDPDFVKRLNEERDAVAARLTAAESRVKALEVRIVALGSSQKSAVKAASARMNMGSNREASSKASLEAAKATEKAAQLNLTRQSTLYDKGLASRRALELAELEAVRARNEVERAHITLDAARTEVQALSADESRISNDSEAAISDAQAAKAVALAEIAAAKAELTRIQTRVARQANQHILAPAKGTVLRITARQIGDMVKSGDTLAVFVPETNQQAVELFIDGNDVNLVRIGSPVRLQFEGWPAFQFSGWPSTAVGTFAGKVAFVDTHDDGKGQFRVLVVSDRENTWPSRQYLRQGTYATGWILLKEVKLGYEIWRIFNDFPPEWMGEKSLQTNTGDKAEKK